MANTAGRQHDLQGHTVALLLIVAFFCLEDIPEHERSRRTILQYLVRSLENVCRSHSYLRLSLMECRRICA